MKLEKKVVLYVSILLVLMTAQQAISPVAAAVMVRQFVTCKAIDETKSPREAVDITDVFYTTEKNVYALLVLDNVQPPITVSIAAYRPDGIEYGRAKQEFTAGPTISFYVWLDIPTISRFTGQWRLEALVDSTLASTVYFELSLPAPRLSISSASIKPGAGEPIYVDDPVTVTYTLRNIGVATASSVEVRVVESPSELAVETTPPKSLAPGLSDTWQVTIRPKKAGEFRVAVSFYMDGVKQVFRLADGTKKDTFTITIVVSLKPVYLVIQRITTQPSTSEPFYVGDVGTITYTVKNTGQAVGKNVEIRVVIVPPEIEVVQVTAPKDLQPGATDEWQVKLRAKSPGTYEAYLTFYVDGKKVIFEAEGKTIEQWKIPIVATEKPFTQTLGFLVVLGLALVAVIVVVALVMRKRRPVAPSITPPVQLTPTPTPMQPSPTPEQKFCFSCGSSMPLATRFCPKCGAEQQR